jgi:putative ABC transport system substrate-binding protein
VLSAVTERDVESVFATAVEQRADAMLVSADPFFLNQRDQIVALAARHSLPAAYQWREFVDAGGLMSYGTSIVDAYETGPRHLREGSFVAGA